MGGENIFKTVFGWTDEQLLKLQPLIDEWELISIKQLLASAQGRDNVADSYTSVRNSLEYEIENLIKSLQ